VEQEHLDGRADAGRLTAFAENGNEGSAELELEQLRTTVQELRRALTAAELRAEQAQGERDKTERAVRASERIYRAIGESIDFGIWICAPDGRNTYASQSFLDLVGITQEQCSNFGWGELLHPDDSERTIAAWKDCVRTRGRWDIEHRYLRTDGEYHPVLARGFPVSNEAGEIECWAGINLDIGRLKQTEAQLRQNQKRLELMAETASRLLGAEDPLAVVNDLCLKVMEHIDCQVFINYVTDPSSQRLRLNAYSGITADAARQVERLDFGVAVCGRVAQEKRRIVAESIRQSADPQTAFVRSCGVQAYCCHPLIANERVLGTLSFGLVNRAHFTADELALMQTVADQVATAMQRLATLQELGQANAQLREVDRQRSDFLAVLSHELRNPLAPIRNCLYILDHAPPGGAQASKAKQIIDRQVNQLTRLVDDLLDVTRLTRGKLRIQKGRIDLSDLVMRTAEDHRLQFDEARIQFQVRIEPAQRIWVEGDDARLAQAIGNLLCNATKFTPAGGHVSLELGAEGSDRAVIRVQDDGVGISGEVFARLFEPFVQADDSLDRSKGGLGLGLSLVRSMVELHGGSIAAFSAGPGKGAVFVIRLPAEIQEQSRPEVTHPSRIPACRRVLLIEDNMDAVESLRELLALGGHIVEFALSGPEGLEKARQMKPDVVLCDIGLPGFDGYAVARAIRSDDSLRGLRLIALSGYAQADDLELARRAGFDLHVAKPATQQRLMEVLALDSRALSER